jgi:hypothetical protein
MAMASQLRHQVLSQRTPRQQRCLHHDCVPLIRGVGGGLDEYHLAIGVRRLSVCGFDSQAP